MGRRLPVALLDPQARRRWRVGVQQVGQFHNTRLTGIGAAHDPAVPCRDHPCKSGAAQIDHKVPRADQPQIQIEPVAVISLLSQRDDAFDARGALEQRAGEMAGNHRDPRRWKGIGQQPKQTGGEYTTSPIRVLVRNRMRARDRKYGRRIRRTCRPANLEPSWHPCPPMRRHGASTSRIASASRRRRWKLRTLNGSIPR